jgi:hypothetical protein
MSVLRAGEQDAYSDQELEAAKARAEGRPYDRGAYNRYLKKKTKNEKHLDDRNTGKDRGQPKRRSNFEETVARILFPTLEWPGMPRAQPSHGEIVVAEAVIVIVIAGIFVVSRA